MNKPKIFFLCDVKGWAWDIKTHYIKKYLEPYYDIDIGYSCFNKVNIDKNKYNLYFAYGYAFTQEITHKNNKNKCITGVTAHRKKLQIKRAIESTAHHHANSVLLVKMLQSMGKKPFYVPNGVDTKLFYPIKPLYDNRSKMSIGHIGKKSKNKNQKSFIEPILNELRIDYKPHYNDYSNAIPHNQMIHKYQDFDIFIAASSEDGTPNGMLEAGACGRPVIINNIGNAPELIKNGYNGFIVNMDKDAYIDAIRYCKRNPMKVKEMGQNMLKEIQTKWTWELMSKNYLYMFDTILGIKRDKKLYINPAINHIHKCFENLKGL